MLYLIITIVLICLATISTSQWIEGIGPNSPTLYRADYGSCVGFYNQSIYLLGGYDNEQQLTEYLIADNMFINHGPSYLSPLSIFGYPQYWAQVDNILYVFQGKQTISIFDMETNSFTSSYISNIPTEIVARCITSSSTHLFLLGGEFSGASVSNVELYNISNNKWQSDTPAMQTTRGVLSCIFHAGTNKLYAIGGLQQRDNIWEDSIERIEINDIIQNVNAWTYIEPLSEKLSDTRCVTYKNIIYIIGGYNGNGPTNKVHVINVLSDNVTLFADSISMSLSDVAPIIVDHILYVFGGYIDSGDTGINTWMTYDLYQLSIHLRSTTAPSSLPTTQNDTENNDFIFTSSLFLWGILSFTLLATILIYVSCRYFRKRKLMRMQAKLKWQQNNETDDDVTDSGAAPMKQSNECLAIKHWLDSFAFAKYYEHFYLNGYDSIEVIKLINNTQELLAIGIDSEEDRSKIMREIVKISVPLAECDMYTEGNDEIQENIADDAFIVEDNDTLNARTTKRAINKHYLEWTADEVVDWMMTLDEGRYKKYESGLRIKFAEESVDGNAIQYITTSELKGWGINHFMDRTNLHQQVQQLTSDQKATVTQLQ